MKDWGDVSLYSVLLHFKSASKQAHVHNSNDKSQLLVQIPLNFQYRDLSIEYYIEIIKVCLKITIN